MKTESPASIVMRGQWWHVGAEELAAWLGINQATLHRWKDPATFAKATGHAATLVRMLAPIAGEKLTHEQAHYCRLARKDRGELGAFAHLVWLATQELAPPAKARSPRRRTSAAAAAPRIRK